MLGAMENNFIYEITNFNVDSELYLDEYNSISNKEAHGYGNDGYIVIDEFATGVKCEKLMKLATDFLDYFQFNERRENFLKNARYFLQPAGSTLLPHCDARIKCAANFLLYRDNDPVQFYDDEGENPVDLYYRNCIINTRKPHGLSVSKDRLMIKFLFKDSYFDEVIQRIRAV